MSTIFDVPGTNPPNPFSAPIQSILGTTGLPSEDDLSAQQLGKAAADLVTTVTASPDPANALWQLWDAFFIAVATSASYRSHLALLDALRAQPPTQPTNVTPGSDAERQLRSYTSDDGGKLLDWSALPRFSAQWRDFHDILEAYRDWDGVRGGASSSESSSPKLSSRPDEYFSRFCAFSAALVKATNGKGGVHPINVFYACRNVLERGTHQTHEQPRPHRMKPEEVWPLDIRVAATWVRDGGRALWETDKEELRRHWAVPLDSKTELWPKGDGLTQERWRLWADRLRSLGAEDGTLDEETRAVVTEAAAVVEGLLGENSD
ncbi:hypothetical protein B0H66DRAFT_561720 [Apodospora peruviana]|uniref:Uncharacterized protein n=1 Tax=Apodospora peruviana TaxID=516989 RepID=A0AAE0M282_9PEZI|nr:hypothetical protein B0H66DRAFT_561720 [Apodospora peruviana]